MPPSMTLEYLTTTRIGKKSQITIPNRFCKDLDLGNGASIAVFRLGDGLILLPEQQRFERLCEQISARLTGTSLNSAELLATLPTARDRFYERVYGGRPRGKRLI